MRYLIIAGSTDETAIRVFCILRARYGGDQVKIVSSEELEMAPRWILHLDHSYIQLASGLVLDNIGAVYQRIRYTQAPQFAGSSDHDRSYAVSETHALLLAWLAGLKCPVINPPHPMGLGGLERRLIDWLALGLQVGLPVVELEWSTFHGERIELLGTEQRRVLVAGKFVLGDVPEGLESGCVRLAEVARCNLLEVVFASTAHGWRLLGATPYPTDADRIAAALEGMT